MSKNDQFDYETILAESLEIIGIYEHVMDTIT